MERVRQILDLFATKEIIMVREIKAFGKRAAVMFNPDLTDSEIIRNLLYSVEHFRGKGLKLGDLLKEVLYVSEAKVETEQEQAVKFLLEGDCVLVIDNIAGYLIANARKWDKRSVAEPPTETVLKGPREGFIEDIKTNLSLLERRLKTPALAIEKMKIGRQSGSNIAIAYVSTIVDPKLVEQVRKKLSAIDTDSISDSYFLQPILEENPYSIFQQSGFSEKPDIVAAKILEGRVAILVDGSPMVLTVPFLLIEDFQSAEDYYERSAFASFMRIIRYVSLILAVVLPGLYVSLQIYHYDLIPLKFLVTLMSAVKGIPLPPLAETLFVMLLFEMIKEASIRMPRAVGMAMSIVGAIVLGDTAVKAGLIGSPAVMIVAVSSIALFTVPNQVGTMSLLRVAFTLIGGLMGLFGMLIFVLYLLFYLSNLENFSTPYLAPLSPLIKGDLKDAVVRKPLFTLKKRPKSIKNINATRQK